MEKEAKTVLIVEDSPAQALALEHLLEEHGLKVLWAPDGQAGIALAHQHLPDVIVLDIEMPRMGGFETCRRLKEDARTADIPVVMFTIRDDATAALRGIDLGAVDFIPKDAFSNTVLLETLRQLHILPEATPGGREGNPMIAQPPGRAEESGEGHVVDPLACP
ncbi:MAG: response regulator [Anaerolineae bacterium]|nr:response regulator [Anaerolineae bacterium]